MADEIKIASAAEVAERRAALDRVATDQGQPVLLPKLGVYYRLRRLDRMGHFLQTLAPSSGYLVGEALAGMEEAGIKEPDHAQPTRTPEEEERQGREFAETVSYAIVEPLGTVHLLPREDIMFIYRYAVGVDGSAVVQTEEGPVDAQTLARFLPPKLARIKRTRAPRAQLQHQAQRAPGDH